MFYQHTFIRKQVKILTAVRSRWQAYKNIFSALNLATFSDFYTMFLF